MYNPGIDFSLYLVTGSFDSIEPEHYYRRIDDALRGGVTLLQLREKEATSKQLYLMAKRLKNMTDSYHIPLIINDRADIALAVNADGVHVGQNDLPASSVRKLIGRDKIIGVSAATVEEAVRAEKDGADYLGVGAIFPTRSKQDATAASMSTLKAIRQAVRIPIVAIGGINISNIDLFDPEDINGVAVISAILSQKDVFGAAHGLKEKTSRIAGHHNRLTSRHDRA